MNERERAIIITDVTVKAVMLYPGEPYHIRTADTSDIGEVLNANDPIKEVKIETVLVNPMMYYIPDGEYTDQDGRLIPVFKPALIGISPKVHEALRIPFEMFRTQTELVDAQDKDITDLKRRLRAFTEILGSCTIVNRHYETMSFWKRLAFLFKGKLS